MSFVGSYVFNDIFGRYQHIRLNDKLANMRPRLQLDDENQLIKCFPRTVDTFPPLQSIHFEMAKLNNLTWTGVLTSMGLGFTLSLLFFMDQNISAAMVNAPKNG